jgi:response regulator RpfG family c-di-GMP phosphodiesterase
MMNSAERKIRVLIVDDSRSPDAPSARLLRAIRDPRLGAASDAMSRATRYGSQPDVVTLDLEVPRWMGLASSRFYRNITQCRSSW